MNIFVLDLYQKRCAEYHTNVHVNKMLIESVQILSTVCRINGINEGYKITHKNHPCTKWALQSFSNWDWLRGLVFHLNNEWQYRFNHSRNHKSFEAMLKLPVKVMQEKMCNGGLTPFVLAMPEEYKCNDAIKAYRAYYNGGKKHLFNWGKRGVPYWIKQ